MTLPSFLEDLDPEIFWRNDYLVLDFEVDTSAGDFGHPRHPANHLLLACWKEHGSCTKCKRADELHQPQLVESIQRSSFLVCHGCKYELGWIKRMGLDLHDVYAYDTMLGEYVLLGNLASGSEEMGVAPTSLALGDVCKRRGLPDKDPVVDVLIEHGINPVHIPAQWLRDRCIRDVETTEQVFLQQRAELDASNRLPVQYTRCLLTPLLAELEQEGMAEDKAVVDVEYAKAVKEEKRLLAEMSKLTGGINSRSPVQMATFLYASEKDGGLGFAELTTRRGEPKRNKARKGFPLGTPLTDKDTLDALKATTKRQKEFVALRRELGKVQALLSKNLDFFKKVADEYGGLFYGEILQTGTATHRTASRGARLTFADGTTATVQTQNIPRKIKHVIKAKREGWNVADIDLAQIEFRVAALLGNDVQAIKDIADPNFDAHMFSASEIFAKTPEELKLEKAAADKAGRDSLRQKAKPHTYKPLYGGQYGTPAEERYYAAFRKRYSGITAAQDAWIRSAVETKQVVTPWGLIYYFPTARMSGNGRVNVGTAVSNYPIQGLATGEIAPVGAVYFWHLIHQAGLDGKMRIINLVHDSSPTEVAPGYEEQLISLSKEAYTSRVFFFFRNVYSLDLAPIKLGVGVKIGTHWGTGKENVWDIDSNGIEVKRK